MQDKGQGHLVERLPKTLGHGIGLELRESALAISAKNAATVKAGMVFHLQLGACLACPACQHQHGKVQKNKTLHEPTLNSPYVVCISANTGGSAYSRSLPCAVLCGTGAALEHSLKAHVSHASMLILHALTAAYVHPSKLPQQSKHGHLPFVVCRSCELC